MKLVLKYGGTSISTAKHIKEVAKHINKLSKQNQIVIVCSAISGITDDLLEKHQLILKGKKTNAKELTQKIIQRHKQLAKETISNTKLRKNLLENLDSDFSELVALIDGMVLLGEVTPRSLDYLISFGERLSIKIVSSALLDTGIKSVSLTGKEVGIVTDSNFGESKPLMDTTRLHVYKTIDLLFTKKTIPVIGGFTGADQHGRVTTFGRGGSDYTATTIASCINADETNCIDSLSPNEIR